MTTKEYLNSYKRIIAKIRVLERDIEKLTAEIGGGSLKSDGMPHGTSLSDSTGDIATRLADIKRKREQMLLEAVDRRDEITQLILKVQDPIYMKLLYSRYVELMDWNDVTEALGLYNDQYVRGKLHSRALDAAEEILK